VSPRTSSSKKCSLKSVPSTAVHPRTKKNDIMDRYQLKSILPHPCGDDTAKFTDETFETDAELTAKYKTGLNMPEHIDYKTVLVTEEEFASLPAEFDWREQIKAKYGQDATAATVLNQGSCGSCWAFGAATAAGYRSIIESKGQFNVVPSTQVGMSCAKPVDQGQNPCGGGWFNSFYNTMAKDGIPANWAVPYTAKGGPCTVSHDSIGLKGGTSRSIKGVEAMMKELHDNGPFGLAIDANSAFQRYKSGVVSAGGSGVTHAVVAVGYGNEGGKPYWLVQNSWGAGWGDNGFIKVERGNNALNMEQHGAQPNFMSEDEMSCKDSPPCKNGGAFRKNCKCRCLSGYSGAQCDSCQKSCDGAQFTGTAGITNGNCQCQCSAGYVTPSNLLGYSDCALKMAVPAKEAKGVSVAVPFSVAGTAPSDPIQNVKKGDMLVAVPAGEVPWTAQGGWVDDIKADICGTKKWPAEPCGASTPSLTFSKDGVYDVFFVKYLGVSEFGTDKGYGSDFMRLPQKICIGNANCNAPTPPPPPPPPAPPAPPTPPPSTPPPSPPSGDCTDRSHQCKGWVSYCGRATVKSGGKKIPIEQFCCKTCEKQEKEGPGPAPAPPPTPPPSCKNKHTNCPKWGKRYCNTRATVNGESFKIFCCATCS